MPHALDSEDIGELDMTRKITSGKFGVHPTEIHDTQNRLEFYP